VEKLFFLSFYICRCLSFSHGVRYKSRNLGGRGCGENILRVHQKTLRCGSDKRAAHKFFHSAQKFVPLYSCCPFDISVEWHRPQVCSVPGTLYFQFIGYKALIVCFASSSSLGQKCKSANWTTYTLHTQKNCAVSDKTLIPHPTLP
jgi:hypothetical protein